MWLDARDGIFYDVIFAKEIWTVKGLEWELGATFFVCLYSI